MTDEKVKTEEKKEPVFDADRPIKINLQSPEGVKVIALRFPTDAEWIERRRKLKIVEKDLGRGKSQRIPLDSREVDAELLAKIRTDADGPEVNEYEAVEFIEILSQADLDEIVRDGNTYCVTLRVPGGKTTHVVEMPTSEDRFKYFRACSYMVDLGGGKHSITVNLVAGGDLYKKRSKSAEGYAGPVPIIHQAEVISAIISNIEGSKGSDSENF